MSDLPVEDQVAVVRAFLVRCRDWASEREIPVRLEQIRQEPRAQQAAALHAWLSYRDFVEHALAELDSGALDHWFPRPDNR